LARAVASLTATTRQLSAGLALKDFFACYGWAPHPFALGMGIKIAGLDYRILRNHVRLTVSIQLSKRPVCQALWGLTVCPLIEISIAQAFDKSQGNKSHFFHEIKLHLCYKFSDGDFRKPLPKISNDC
jgi:hypothetical protein